MLIVCIFILFPVTCVNSGGLFTAAVTHHRLKPGLCQLFVTLITYSRWRCEKHYYASHDSGFYLFIFFINPLFWSDLKLQVSYG